MVWSEKIENGTIYTETFTGPERKGKLKRKGKVKRPLSNHSITNLSMTIGFSSENRIMEICQEPLVLCGQDKIRLFNVYTGFIDDLRETLNKCLLTKCKM